MANIEKTINTKGEVVYKVQVSGGRGRRVKRSWKPVPGWSARTIERELNKFIANLENQMANGELVTRREEKERQEKEAAEAAKLKTLKQYCECVFMPAKEASISENTRSSYQNNLDKHIYPAFGDRLITEITSVMITGFLLGLQKSSYSRNADSVSSKAYSHATVIKVYNLLNGIFNMAFQDDTIPANPMLKVARPKPRKDEEITNAADDAYTAAELRYILKCLEKEPLKWRVFVNLVADTGARRGEVGGLQWTDIDFDGCMVKFMRNLQYTPQKGVYVDTLKNRQTRGTDVGPDTIELLRQLRQEQAKTCISKWVFTQENSPEVMHPQTPTRYFKKIEKRYGIKDFHPHKLRHTSASIAVTQGADVASVAGRLGHSDPATTLRRYTHADEESRRRAGQVVRDAVKAAEIAK